MAHAQRQPETQMERRRLADTSPATHNRHLATSRRRSMPKAA
ncbi:MULTISPECIES: hypothetical protein [Kingella]|nr:MULTISPECIES: hypothetical protein [Kingella]